MKRNSFHAISGFFIMISGVIGLSVVITTYQTLAAMPEANDELMQSTELVSANVQQEITPSAKMPFVIETVPSWNHVIFDQHPAKISQVVGYMRITSTSETPVVLRSMMLGLQSNQAFEGYVALVRMPPGGAFSETSLDGFGLPTDNSATSTIGLAQMSSGTLTKLPLVDAVVIPAYGSIIVGITADNIPDVLDPFTMNFSVNHVEWSLQEDAESEIFSNSSVNFELPPVTFKVE